SRPVNIFLGLLLLLVSALLFLSLATWHATDPSLNTSTDPVATHAARNWIGIFGALISDLMLQVLGLTSFLIPIWIGGLGWTWMRSRSGGSPILRWIGTLFALTFIPTVFALLPWRWNWMHLIPVEGVVGKLMAGMLVGYLNIQGAWVVAGVLAAMGLYFASAISFWALKESFEERWIHVVSWYERWRNWREQRAEARAEREIEESDSEPEPEPAVQTESHKAGFFASLFRRRREAEADPIDEIPAFKRTGMLRDEEEPVAIEPRRPSIWEHSDDRLDERETAAPVYENRNDISDPRDAVPQPPKVAPIRPPVTPQPAHFTPAARSSDQPPAAFRTPSLGFETAAAAPSHQPQASGAIAIHGRADAEIRTATVAPKNVSGFKLPPSTLLNAGEGPQSIREEVLREEARVLVEKCAEFDVRGQVVQINPGPMVTTYEFKTEAGVKYSRVTSLADDLCLAMRAESILIERMPGKSTVGIQVPNHERETIHLREVLESETFARAKSRLTLAMGKDINGRIVTADLASMPHLLIAGSTGSGKSVAINAMIMSLLYRTTPSQVRFILVDPKRVELGMYEGVPHLFTPIITEPKLAANALRNAVREMERRLKLLASRSVRHIDQYNKLFEGSMPSLFDDGETEEPLPYIVIIIDELADLMMLDRANVEESITRLAQMARAVGIHLILATQRPSVDVITGLIKANVPTRISFRLATKVDSRTILDTNGAEALLGRGDMLFLPPGTSRLMRLHAPYVSEKETAAVVSFWKDQGQAEYVEGFLESPKDERASVDGSNPDPDENDPLFDDAVRLVFEFGKASTSLLQRRLRIGYGRAAHLIDLMERDGLVGPADGSRPRELLKAPGWLHEISAVNE
ncbi:MAG: DNA translocase FtsK, partial [Terracidiphilus sp.]